MYSVIVFVSFRVFCLQLVATATILVGVTLRDSAKWDEYKTIVEPPSPAKMFRVDAYQNLWAIDVKADETSSDRVYPLPGEDVDIAWRDRVYIKILAAASFGATCFLFLLVSAILHYIKPRPLYTVVTLGINFTICITAGITPFWATKDYSENYQTVLRPQVLVLRDQYNPDENVFGIDFWYALTGSAIFGVASIVIFINFLVEFVLLRKENKEDSRIKPLRKRDFR